VTLTEYSDFQCPFCAQLAGVLQELEARYPDQINLIYRHFPLIGTPEQPLHDKAALSMQAAEAAGLQGKFWEMHDALFAAQAEWTAMSAEDFEAWLMDTAESLELDMAQFTADLHSEENAAAAQAAWEAGQELQLGGTPFLLINGLPYSGPLDIASLDTILQLEFLRAREYNECPEMQLENGVSYTATLHTAKGDIVIELFPEVAPIAVNSFVFLAEDDWFDNVTFHRVLPGFVAQAGDPTGTGYGGPGYSFAIEVDPNLTFDRAGLLAMANSGPTSNGSQFFITYGPTEHLNGQFTIFGEVIQGMDVVESLTPRDPSVDPNLPPGDLILDVTIEAH
jgi:cyclophilin family peptidyl-prolyl cis-trans isomerase/predicted DsbA family dithiol-disulfide isomerase